MNPRTKVAVAFQKRLLPTAFTILSDDCYGGQLYRQLNIPYNTPTVGLWIGIPDYLTFIENINQPDASQLSFISTDETYPVGQTPYCREIHFLHYRHSQDMIENQRDVTQKWYRRWDRMDTSHLFIKIDFGKPSATEADIDRWNQLQLPNSLAIVPPTFSHIAVHNGLVIPEWVNDGAALFDISRRHFTIFDWLRTGQIHNPIGYRLLSTMLYDPTVLRRLKRFMLSKSKRPA